MNEKIATSRQMRSRFMPGTLPVGLLATFRPRSAAADHRQAASSTT
jgi:hypothetical protein